MKRKFKLVPSVLLLVLCLGILGVGIYAAKPASNTISGTVTVNSAGAEVEISVYQGSYDPENPATNRQSGPYNTRTGISTLSMGDFTFDAGNYNNANEVPMKKVIIVIKNHSFKENGLGAYFWNTENNYADSVYIHSTTNSETGFVAGTVPTQAEIIKPSDTEYSDILYGHHKYASNDETPVEDVIDVEYEFYKHIPAATDNTESGTTGVWDSNDTAGEEYITMYVRLNKMVETDVTVELNVKLNIEEYVASEIEYASSPAWDNGPPDSFIRNAGFVRMPVGDTRSFTGSYGGSNQDVTHVVYPSWGDTSNCHFGSCGNLVAVSVPGVAFSVSTYYGLFEGCTNLTSVFIPYFATSLLSRCFKGCTGLTTIEIPSSVTSLGYSCFENCTSLTSIEIPSSVTSLGYSCFSGCTNLTSATFKTTTNWQVNPDGDFLSNVTDLSSSDLENTSTAATYLKSTHASKYWRRTA